MLGPCALLLIPIIGNIAVYLYDKRAATRHKITSVINDRFKKVCPDPSVRVDSEHSDPLRKFKKHEGYDSLKLPNLDVIVNKQPIELDRFDQLPDKEKINYAFEQLQENNYFWFRQLSNEEKIILINAEPLLIKVIGSIAYEGIINEYVDTQLAPIEENPELFDTLTPETQMLFVRRQYENHETVPYDKLSIDQIGEFVRETYFAEEVLNKIPSELLKKIADKDPTFVDFTEFRQKLFKENPAYIGSLSPKKQKKFLVEYHKKDFDFFKILMPLASENVQIDMIAKDKNWYEKNQDLYEYASPNTYSKILNKTPDDFQKKVLANEENQQKFLKYASLKIQNYFVNENKANITLTSGEFQSMQIRKQEIYDQLMKLSDEEFFDDGHLSDNVEELFGELQNLFEQSDGKFPDEIPQNLQERIKDFI